MKIKNLIKRHPVTSYFFLVFLISWGGSVLGGAAFFLQGEVPSLKDVIPMGLAMMIAPSFGGLFMTYLTDGRKGVRDLFARMTKWQVGGPWYAVLLIFPGLILATLIPLSILVTPALTPNFFAAGILMGLVAGFCEELGWMGFVYPKMREKNSFLRASISLGLLHALWHLAADFLGNYHAFGGNWLAYFLGFSVFVVALRILIAWVYENTGSLLLAQLLHASSSGFLSILVPISDKGATWHIFYAVYAVVLWVVAAIVLVRYAGHLVNSPVRKTVV
jgi:membrane protease YdiL (CAAX protease family)